MGRRCVCKICKTEGNTDYFYRIHKGGKNTYYCSKDEYDKFVEEKQKREDLLEYIAIEIFEYEEGQIAPPVLMKKIKKINKFYDYDVIKECFKESKENIQYWMKAKNFDSEFGMVSYIMKIIESNINDVYEKWKHQKRQEKKQNNEFVDVGLLNDSETNEVNKVVNNGIMDFLDEEDI